MQHIDFASATAVVGAPVSDNIDKFIHVVDLVNVVFFISLSKSRAAPVPDDTPRVDSLYEKRQSVVSNIICHVTRGLITSSMH
jgi:hypothetical protein